MVETEAIINSRSFKETLNHVNSHISKAPSNVLTIKTIKTDVKFPLPGIFGRLELFS